MTDRLSRSTTDGALTAATGALLAAACLPLARAYHGLAFFRPVLAALLLVLVLAWGVRRLGFGPLAGILVSVSGWALFVTVVFLADTLRGGVLPTGDTLAAGHQLWVRGFELLQARPAPVFAEAGLLLLTVTGVWAVGHAVDALVFWLRSPVKAVGMAAVLWVAPLAVTPGAHSALPWAAPFLVAAAGMLLVSGVTELRRWGQPTEGPGAETTLAQLAPRGAVLAVGAIAVGGLLAGSLPGYDDPAWYRVRAPAGGTTVTDNPIVTIRASLVAEGQQPLLRVRTARPVYLRTTSLDVYSQGEEWTNSGIRGAPVTGPVPFERPIARSEEVEVEVEVEHLPGAVLIPVPYQVQELSGPVSSRFHYDPGLSTVTLGRNAGLDPGDRYGAVSAIPAPDPAAAPAQVVRDPSSPLVGLPPGIPDSVAALAREIVAQAGAQTPFEEALAVQDELRTWTYSLEPPPGHHARAMESFVENRIGYCEQYAGTMAVMLRSLGIPARVAVGFTPGELVDEGEYAITNRHAHAWVEVLTTGHGWLAFEPTPRDDNNVIVPSAVNLAPTRTVAQQQASAEPPGLPDPAPGDVDFLPEPGADGPDGAGEPQPAPTEAAASGGLWRVIGLLLVVVTAAGIAGAALLHPRAGAGRPAAQRILDARRQAEQVARGLGIHPRPTETDAEYLARVARGADGNGAAGPAALTLAGHCARVRYGPYEAMAGADEAEAAAAALVNALVGDLWLPRRTLVEVRGGVARVLRYSSR